MQAHAAMIGCQFVVLLTVSVDADADGALALDAALLGLFKGEDWATGDNTWLTDTESGGGGKGSAEDAIKLLNTSLTNHSCKFASS